MIVFDRVSKVYPGGNTALKNVSLHIQKGEFVFVLGHSGAGKSTFLKLILREEKATSGRVFVNGKDLTRMKERDVPYLRRNMGVVFQDFRLIPSMTAYENVAFAMRVTNIPEKKIASRVALARALVHSPQLIIADEPTGNIDPELSIEMMELLSAINSVGITVVVVTHEHELARHFSKRVITIDHGNVIGDSQNRQDAGEDAGEVIL